MSATGPDTYSLSDEFARDIRFTSRTAHGSYLQLFNVILLRDEIFVGNLCQAVLTSSMEKRKKGKEFSYFVYYQLIIRKKIVCFNFLWNNAIR